MSNASEALVDLYCKELRLPGLKRAYRDIAREALAQGRTPVDFLAACLAQELASRRESRIRARLAQARPQSRIQPLDGGVWGCHLDGCATGPAHPPRAHPAL